MNTIEYSDRNFLLPELKSGTKSKLSHSVYDQNLELSRTPSNVFERASNSPLFDSKKSISVLSKQAVMMPITQEHIRKAYR